MILFSLTTWLIALAVIINLIFFSRRDYGWAAICFFGAIAAWLVTNIPTPVDWSYVRELALTCWYYVAGYIGIGAIVAALYWFVRVSDMSAAIGRARARIAELSAEDFAKAANHMIGYHPHLASASESWDERAQQNAVLMYNIAHNNAVRTVGGQSIHMPSGTNFSDARLIAYLTPEARKYMYEISMWTINWPALVIDVTLGKIVLRLGERIVDAVDKLFGGLSKRLISSGFDSK